MLQDLKFHCETTAKIRFCMFQQLKKYIFPKQIRIILSCDDRISESGTWMDGWMKIIFLSASTIVGLRASKLTDHLFLRLSEVSTRCEIRHH